MNRPPRRSRPPRVFAVATALLLAGNCLADDKPLGQLRTLPVAENTPASWPSGDWEPVHRDEFLRLQAGRAAATRRPAAAWVRRAVYSATVDGTRLRDGSFEFELPPGRREPVRLALWPLNLAVSAIEQAGRPASWGTAAAGRPMLVARPDSDRVTGRWTHQGRSLGSIVEFDLRLVPAAISELVLTLPADRVPSAVPGTVSGPSPGGDATTRVWHIVIGGRRRVRLTVEGISDRRAIPARVFVHQRTACKVGPAGARLQAELQLDVYDAPIDRLTLAVPPDLDAETVEVVYDEQPVNWRLGTGPDAGQLEIELADPLRGRGRLLRVTGVAPVRTAVAWRLPRISLPTATLVPGPADAAEPDLTLEVLAPLELKTIAVDGYRQTAHAVGGRRFTFEQFQADASLTLRVGTPAASITTAVLHLLDLTRNDWRLTAEVVCSARTGSTFTTRCDVPTGWELTDVTPAGGSGRTTWWTEPGATTGEQLVLEFTEAVTPRAAQVVVVSARRVRLATAAIELPVLSPRTSDGSEQLLAIRGGGGALEPLGAIIREQLDEIDRDIVPRRWKLFSTWSQIDRDPGIRLFTLRPARGGERPAAVAGESTALSPEPGGAPGDADPPAAVVGEATAVSDRSPADGRPVSLELLSRFGPGGDTDDRHAAVVTFDGGRYDTPFVFSLPSTARLDRVLVNGQPARPEPTGNGYAIPPLEQGTLRTIEIRYRATGRGGFLQTSRSIPVPQLDSPVAFTWRCAVPPDLQLAGQSIDLVPADPGDTVTVCERLFGPLGRSGRRAMFNPLSWSSWKTWLASSPASPPADPAIAPAIAPANWAVFHGQAMSVPSRISASCLRRDRVELLGWAGLLACLAGGLIIRLWIPVGRPEPVACWLSLLGTLAWLVPDAWVSVPGGCLAGSLFAVLLPRRILVRPSAPRTERRTSELDSTRSFRHVPAGMLLLATLAATWPGFAQEPPSPAQVDPPDALIPVDNTGKPSRSIPFVFVDRMVLAQLRHAAGQPRGIPEYLLTSARYEGRVKDDAGLELTARFTVSRNDARRGVTVRLPLTGGNLGPDACRVNGLRHPVSRSPDGLGLLVELPARPTTAAVPAAGRVDEIVFDLHPVVRRTGGGRTIQLGIPPVLDSRVELTLPAGFPKLVVPDIHDHTAAGRHVVPLSWTNRLELTWLPSGASRAPGAKVSAQVLGRIDLHPLRRKVDYRVRVQVESGGIDFVTLTLPGGVVVDAGDVAADDVLAVSVLPIAEDRRRIVVEFTGPRSGEFEIRVSGRRPRSDSADSVIQLKPNLVLSHGTPATVVPIRETVIGVTPAPGFQLIQIGLLPTGTKTVDPAEFAGLWVIGAETDPPPPPPQLAYRTDPASAVPLSIEPLVPRCEVRIEQLGYVIPGRLELTVNASIKTTHAHVYQHELIVDPRLKISSVSVRQEDGAERLARHSRVGNRLVLFLKENNLFDEESNTGVQDVSIRASMPIDANGETVFPDLRVIDADLADSILNVYHDPQLNVRLQGAEPLSPGPDDRPDPAAIEFDAREVPLGRFRLPADPTAATLLVNRPSVPRRVRLLNRLAPGETDGWAWTGLVIVVGEVEGVRRPIVLTLPAELAAAEDLLIEPQPTQQTTQPDGSLRVTIIPVNTSGGNSIRLSARLPAPDPATNWSLPVPTVIRPSIVERVLVLPSQAGWVPGGQDVERLSTRPDWITVAIPGSVPESESVFRGRRAGWELVPAAVETPPDRSAPAPPPTPPPAERPPPTTATETASAASTILRLIVTLAVGIVVAVGLVFLLASPLAAWTSRREPVRWALVGLTWWIAMTPSALGLLIVAGAIALGIRRAT